MLGSWLSAPITKRLIMALWKLVMTINVCALAKQRMRRSCPTQIIDAGSLSKSGLSESVSRLFGTYILPSSEEYQSIPLSFVIAVARDQRHSDPIHSYVWFHPTRVLSCILISSVWGGNKLLFIRRTPSEFAESPMLNRIIFPTCTQSVMQAQDN